MKTDLEAVTTNAFFETLARSEKLDPVTFLPKVGDEYMGGKVLAVKHSLHDCYEVTLEMPPPSAY